MKTVLLKRTQLGSKSFLTPLSSCSWVNGSLNFRCFSKNAWQTENVFPNILLYQDKLESFSGRRDSHRGSTQPALVSPDTFWKLSICSTAIFFASHVLYGAKPHINPLFCSSYLEHWDWECISLNLQRMGLKNTPTMNHGTLHQRVMAYRMVTNIPSSSSS